MKEGFSFTELTEYFSKKEGSNNISNNRIAKSSSAVCIMIQFQYTNFAGPFHVNGCEFRIFQLDSAHTKHKGHYNKNFNTIHRETQMNGQTLICRSKVLPGLDRKKLSQMGYGCGESRFC